jgi:hypothetical protein
MTASENDSLIHKIEICMYGLYAMANLVIQCFCCSRAQNLLVLLKNTKHTRISLTISISIIVFD